MSRKQDRINIVQEIKLGASLYKQHLVGKQFLYVFEEKYIEVLFKAENFRHLTGVETNLSAQRFYEYAINKKLAASQIWFTSKYPYGLCKRKIQHIKNIATMAGSECFMLEEITTDKTTYKFGTTDLKFTLCLNKEYNADGSPKSDSYVVQSLRDEDCFSKSKSAYVVTHIFSKQNDEKKYKDLLYIDNSSNLDDLPSDIKSLLDRNIFADKTLD